MSGQIDQVLISPRNRLDEVFAPYGHLDPVLLYVVISLDEIITLPVALVRYRQYKWLKNITREIALAS